MISFTLSPDEMLSAVVVAASRKISSDRRRANGQASRREEHYDEQRAWDQEIESAMAEMGVARWRNVYWTGSRFDGTAGSDAGQAQVRWTPYPNGHLVVYEEDADEQPFVLVVGRSPRMFIVGWRFAADAKQQRYWRCPPVVKCASWWMPQSDLNPIGE